MDSTYPVKLGLFAKSTKLTSVPFAPQGHVFGMVTSGIQLPEGGSFYIVEFDPAHSNRVRIVGYVDKYGRAFSCDEPPVAPPAQMPQVLIQTYPNSQGQKGCIQIQEGPARTSLTPIMEFTKTGDAVAEMRLTFGASLDRASNAGVDFSGMPRDLPYGDFMAMCFLSLYKYLPAEAEHRASAPAAPKVFDLADVFMRLGSGDFFSGIDREVLEAENSWHEDPASARGVERYLVHMLREEGVVGKSLSDFAARLNEGEDPALPSLRLIRTVSYANTYYIDFSYENAFETVENGLFLAHPATAQQRATLIGAEGALNRFLLLTDYLQELGSGKLDEDESLCAQYDQWLIDRICTQAPDPRRPEGVKGRWGRHLKFARACESLRLPYRIGYDFRTNEAGDALAVNVIMPPVASLPKSVWDVQAQAYRPTTPADSNATYVRYAAHICILLAALAMHVSSRLGRVLITCKRSEEKFTPIMSVELTRAVVENAFAQDVDHVFADPFAILGAAGARYQLGDSFELSRIEPLFTFSEGEFALGREELVYDDVAPLNDAARAELGVERGCDLNIFEEHKRRSLAEEAIAAMAQGNDAAVATIKAIHDRTENLTVRRVCQGLLDDFAQGHLDYQSELEVREAFIDAYGFKAPMTRAYALSREGDDVGATQVLDGLQKTVDSCGAFADTSRICYRYFDSYATRVLYEKHCADDRGGRKVLPLANEAYLVHDLYAQVLTGSITGQDEALVHAKRCIELSPAYATAYLRAARAYFVRGDFESEASMCIKALELAWNPEDAGLAFYWLAFAYWKMNRFELAVACYRRCIALGSQMADQAAEECAELVEGVKGLQRHSALKEREIMIEAGIPYDALHKNAEYLLKIAEEAVDSNSDALGTVLASSALRVIRDDALLPTIRSLQP